MRSRLLSIDTGRRLQAMFLAIAALLVGTLLWLGWELTRQDYELAAQRLQERRENVADLAVATMQRALTRTEEQLTHLTTLRQPELSHELRRIASGLPGDSVVLVMQGGALDAYPEKRLPFYPVVPVAPVVPAALFSEAETLEFRQSQYGLAIASLEAHVRSGNPGIRAAALLRKARLHRKLGEWKQAMSTYEEMVQLGGSGVESVPAPLVAMQARMRLQEERRNLDAAREEASALARMMEERQWRLSRGAYEFFWNEAARLLGKSGSVERDPSYALSSVVEQLHEGWKTERERS